MKINLVVDNEKEKMHFFSKLAYSVSQVEENRKNM